MQKRLFLIKKHRQNITTDYPVQHCCKMYPPCENKVFFWPTRWDFQIMIYFSKILFLFTSKKIALNNKVGFYDQQRLTNFNKVVIFFLFRTKLPPCDENKVGNQQGGNNGQKK